MLADDAKDKLNSLVLNALEKIVKENISKIDSTGKPTFSFFLEAMAMKYGQNWVDLAKKFKGEWLNLDLHDETGSKNRKSYKEIFTQDDWILEQFYIQNISVGRSVDLLFEDTKRDIIFNEWLKDKNQSMPIRLLNIVTFPCILL